MEGHLRLKPVGPPGRWCETHLRVVQLRIMKLDCLPSSPNSNGLKPALKSIKSLALLACPHMQAERNPLDGKSQVFAVACY